VGLFCLVFFFLSMCRQPPDSTRLVTCDNIGELLVEQHAFAHGEKKAVRLATFRNRTVVVAGPWLPDDATDADDDVGHVFESYFLRERQLYQRFAKNDVVPEFLGGCWRTWRTTAIVIESLEGFMSVALDPTVSWQQRAKISASAVDVLQLLDHFPASHGEETRAIYGDLFAKQFGVTADLRVKFVDLQSFLPFSTARLGSDHTCASDQDCERAFWERGSFHALRGLRRLQADDFFCNATTARCNGLDSQTVLMALCHLLIEPMFFFARDQTPAAVGETLLQVLDSCVTSRRADRASPAQVRSAFESLIAGEEVPLLQLRNTNARLYQTQKEAFEEVRRAAAARYSFARKAEEKHHEQPDMFN
jgi:hypothetical protein